MPDLHQLRQHLQDCERERDRLASRVRLQRTHPLPAMLGDDLDPDEQALVMAAAEDALDRAEAAVVLAARALADVTAGNVSPAVQRCRSEPALLPALGIGAPGAGRAGRALPAERRSWRAGIVFLGGCLALVAIMQVLAGVAPSVGTLAVIGVGCLLYAAVGWFRRRAQAELVLAGTGLVLLAALHALAGLPPSIGGLVVAAVACLLYGLCGRAWRWVTSTRYSLLT